MKGLILSAVLFVAANASSSFACTLGILPLRDFDKSEFIFIGKVAAYSSPVDGKNLQGRASGLVVTVVESVYLPRTPSKHFEVFSFELYADCSFAGQRAETIRTDFPIGSEVLIIAKDAKFIPQSTDPGVIRL